MPLAPSRRCALGVVLAMMLLTAGPAGTAIARDGVYGGQTKAGDPIVLMTDAEGQKLKSAVFRVRVNGVDRWWPIAGKAAVRQAAGDQAPMPTNLLVAARNSGGRFDARLLTTVIRSSQRIVMAGINLNGALERAHAHGTIAGWVTVTDAATMELLGSYRTGDVKWTAERAAGRVYGGAMANGMPIVLNVNWRATKVTELSLVCHTNRSTPLGWFWNAAESLTNFSLRDGRFGKTLSYREQEPDGTTAAYDWKLAGRVTSTLATGSVALFVSSRQPSGQALAFEMPATKFTAATG
jgi:hypothetical protein